MRFISLLRFPVLASAGAFLCGCPNPNIYGTPRTLDPGTLQWQVAAEAYGASVTVPGTSQTVNGMITTSPSTTASIFTPTLPTFGIRYGVADGFDFGARVANLDTLAADGKIRLLKGTIDLAVDPGLQFIYLGGISTTDSNGNTTSVSDEIIYLHVPLLVGFNLSPSVSLVATPGFVYGLASANVNTSNATQQATASTGIMGRLGLGVNVRVGRSFSLQPEMTFMKAFQNDDALLYIFGVGFNIGAQPDYSDIGGAPNAAPAVAPPAAQ